MAMMLDRWAETLDERTAIESSLETLYTSGHEPPRFHSGREAALDAYFGIDRKQLEVERRQLLNTWTDFQRETAVAEEVRDAKP